MKHVIAELEALANDGYIRRAFHPSGKLAIYNYTEKCAYEGNWNDTTRMCRGLILDEQFNVVARPFSKFFNYGEIHAPDLDLDAPVIVTDKLDGSLGILYPDPAGGFAVASRGSFTSDQAVHATAIWKERYESTWDPDPTGTFLFEIIYPANRIVVDYGGLDEIVLLGAIDRMGGWWPPDDFGWPGMIVDAYPYNTLREALEAPPRDGKEGLVIYFPQTQDRVKIKQDDYVEIHRLVFGLTKRKLWERVGIEMLHANGFNAKAIARTLYMDVAAVEAILPKIDTWLDELLTIVPEEFANWVGETTVDLGTTVFYWIDGVEDTYETIQRELGPKVTDRKSYAAAFNAESSDIVPALFARLDGKSLTPYALRAVQPEHETYKPPEEAE